MGLVTAVIRAAAHFVVGIVGDVKAVQGAEKTGCVGGVGYAQLSPLWQSILGRAPPQQQDTRHLFQQVGNIPVVSEKDLRRRSRKDYETLFAEESTPYGIHKLGALLSVARVSANTAAIISGGHYERSGKRH